MTSFIELRVPEPLSSRLASLGYQQPTPIQVEAIPPALEGKGILGSAQTGSGKTAAFIIPLLAALLKSPGTSGLVLTPTRELAAQILNFATQLLDKQDEIFCTLLIGGHPMGKQLAGLKKNPRLIIGTPGRIKDHLDRATLSLEKSKVFVLDEADRMLDMGFGPQLKVIAAHLPQQRQTMMFSATLSPGIVKLSKQYLQNPVRISIGSTKEKGSHIKQKVVHLTSEALKYKQLESELTARKGTILVFVKTKMGSQRLAKKLICADFKTECIHGDLNQRRRDRIIERFRGKAYRILVATDVVARGLDISHIAHVINYDLPESAQDYIHRIGRTARAGAQGEAVCLVTPSQKRKWALIKRHLSER